MRSMAISTVDKEFQKYFNQLDELQKRSLLTMLKTFLRTQQGAGDRISVEQYNQELEEAMQEIERGETHSHEEVLKLAKGW